MYHTGADMVLCRCDLVVVCPQDVYLQTNTLAALANLAPHCAGLSSHASQRLVSLTEMLSRCLQRLERTSDGRLPPNPMASGVPPDLHLVPMQQSGIKTGLGAPAAQNLA